jgi:hypothetical protein
MGEERLGGTIRGNPAPVGGPGMERDLVFPVPGPYRLTFLLPSATLIRNPLYLK